MIKQLTTLVQASLALGLVFTTGNLYAGDPAAGQQKSAVCAACHGNDGNSPIPDNPRLAGQYADYLEQALHDYQSGARQNPIMSGMVAALSNEDIADIAAWYSSQQGLSILSRDPIGE